MTREQLMARIISATWLGVLGYFFIYSMTLFYPPSKGIYFLSVIFSMCWAFWGFIYRYKILLMPADYLDPFPARCLAGLWFGSLAFFIVLGIDSFIYGNRYTFQPHLITFILLFVFPILAFFIAWIYLYQLLLPKINYLKSFPNFTQRIISAIWFGVIGYLLSIIFVRSTINPLSTFVFLLASYMGFTYGYRILLPSTRDILKSIMIGLLGSSFSLLIVFLMLISWLFLEIFFGPTHQEQRSFGDSIGGGFIFLLLIFPIINLFIGGMGILSSLMLYFISTSRLKKD